MSSLEQLQAAWTAQWPAALALWNRFTQLREPRWCFTSGDEKREKLSGSFAMIRLDDQAIVISLPQIRDRHLESFALEIMGHEIGHHIYCPADLTDHARTITRMRAALPTREHLAGFISNLYTDLLINDRLQRAARLNMSGVYLALGGGANDKLWTLYMRIYEILWSLPKTTLAKGAISAGLEADAALGARVIRAYAKHWLDGAGRFAALCLLYLLEDEGAAAQQIMKPLLDTKNACEGGFPAGLSEIDGAEAEGAIHPSLDKELSGLSDGEEAEGQTGGAGEGGNQRGGKEKKYRQPAQYGEILKSLGVNITPSEIAMKYYRERAMPHLIRFPTRTIPESTDPLPEGFDVWEAGDPLDQVDWFQTIINSPTVIPGLTTVQRTYGTDRGSSPEKQPIDLYLGVDCSGSMINPRLSLSYPVLAGAIISLSALRAGAKVMVTLSGEPGRSVSTEGFVGDERSVLELLTGYLGTGTTFGTHQLEPIFQTRTPASRPVHIMIITDHDIFSMLAQNGGWEVARRALEKARGGGTYVLLMNEDAAATEVKRMRNDGWGVHHVRDWEDIVAFARAFSELKYGEEPTRKR